MHIALGSLCATKMTDNLQTYKRNTPFTRKNRNNNENQNDKNINRNKEVVKKNKIASSLPWIHRLALCDNLDSVKALVLEMVHSIHPCAFQSSWYMTVEESSLETNVPQKKRDSIVSTDVQNAPGSTGMSSLDGRFWIGRHPKNGTVRVPTFLKFSDAWQENQMAKSDTSDDDSDSDSDSDGGGGGVGVGGGGGGNGGDDSDGKVDVDDKDDDDHDDADDIVVVIKNDEDKKSIKGSRNESKDMKIFVERKGESEGKEEKEKERERERGEGETREESGGGKVVDVDATEVEEEGEGEGERERESEGEEDEDDNDKENNGQKSNRNFHHTPRLYSFSYNKRKIPHHQRACAPPTLLRKIARLGGLAFIPFVVYPKCPVSSPSPPFSWIWVYQLKNCKFIESVALQLRVLEGYLKLQELPLGILDVKIQV